MYIFPPIFSEKYRARMPLKNQLCSTDILPGDIGWIFAMDKI
jgi:hypothetical protein